MVLGRAGLGPVVLQAVVVLVMVPLAMVLRVTAQPQALRTAW